MLQITKFKIIFKVSMFQQFLTGSENLYVSFLLSILYTPFLPFVPFNLFHCVFFIVLFPSVLTILAISPSTIFPLARPHAFSPSSASALVGIFFIFIFGEVWLRLSCYFSRSGSRSCHGCFRCFCGCCGFITFQTVGKP